MKNLDWLVLFCVFLMVLIGVQFSHVDLRYFEDVYAREDGVLEWLGVMALFIGAIVSGYRAWQLKDERTKLFTFCLCALCALFVFGAGEEISWGQRLFMIKSPHFFEQHNSQMETNFHNLILGGVKLNKLVFGLLLGIAIGLYFLVLPVAYQKFEKVKSLVNSMAIPIPRWQHLILYLLLGILVKLTASAKKGEILEFGGCWIFLILFYNPKNYYIYLKQRH